MTTQTLIEFIDLSIEAWHESKVPKVGKVGKVVRYLKEEWEGTYFSCIFSISLRFYFTLSRFAISAIPLLNDYNLELSQPSNS